MGRKSIYQQRYEKQMKQRNDFNKAHYKQIAVRFRIDGPTSEKEAYEWAQGQPNTADYIKGLITADMKAKEGK